MVEQYEIQLPPFDRGFHLITNKVLEKVKELPLKGLLNIFIAHTSAGLTISENADPAVRVDFETGFNELVPENVPYYTHTSEGPDDMPSHIKSALVGASVTIPVSNSKLRLGTWQGIYLCEFRYGRRSRKLLVSVYS